MAEKKGPNKHELATKLREVADMAWESGEKDLSTKLHGIAYHFERGTQPPEERLADAIHTIARDFPLSFNNFVNDITSDKGTNK